MPKLDDYDDSPLPPVSTPVPTFANKPAGLPFSATSGFGGSGFGGSSFGSSGQMQQPSAMQEGGTTTLETSKGFGDFINKKWRPMMAFIYMFTCITDFILFPIGWSILQAMSNGTVTSQWNPLTLQGAGLYHIAMGAVLGLAAYGRSQEKIAGKA